MFSYLYMIYILWQLYSSSFKIYWGQIINTITVNIMFLQISLRTKINFLFKLLSYLLRNLFYLPVENNRLTFNSIVDLF